LLCLVLIVTSQINVHLLLHLCSIYVTVIFLILHFQLFLAVICFLSSGLCLKLCNCPIPFLTLVHFSVSQIKHVSTYSILYF
uniref:Uncharacterized protein n=1 Tax=Meleagris gallopavo TaxID=9103 RepID=A0A803Y379_MELGA